MGSEYSAVVFDYSVVSDYSATKIKRMLGGSQARNTGIAR
jgi:hypothetical protein